mgnify:CR=1 FL=1
MSTFGRVKKYTKPSKALDEKAKFLEKELKKTGVVVEAAPANSTANLYTVVRMGNSSKEWIDDSSYNGKALTWGSTTKDLSLCWSPDNLRYATQFEGFGLWGPVPYSERNDVMWYWDSSAGRYYNLQWGNVFDGSSWSITWGAWEATLYGARLSSENLPASLVAALTKDGNVVSPGDLRAPDEPILVARHSLDDADYYPGNPTSFLASLVGTAEKGVEYLKDKADIAGNYTGKYSNRQLQPDGTYGYPKEGDKVNTGGTKGKDFIYQGGNWIPLAAEIDGTQVAGGHYGYGHKGFVDIPGLDWQVSPTQLQKMKDNPERFNLSPAQIRMIKKAEKKMNKQTVSAHYEPQGKVILERKKDPYIKITKKDLDRNHRLKDDEKQELITTINLLNDFIAENPALLKYAQIRYPANDTRLAELNWKMDQMLEASDEYIDTQFPENKKIVDRIKRITQKNIEHTDPKNFKDIELPSTFNYLRSVNSIVVHGYARPVIKYKKNKKSISRLWRKPKSKTKKQIMDEKILQIDRDMQKLL